MDARISRVLLDRLLAEVTASASREVCGLLLGTAEISQAYGYRTWRIDSAKSATNVSVNPADSFEIDPATLFAVIRSERAGGPRVLGHYHSHPHGPIRPSARDAAAALDGGRLWLILGRNDATAWVATSGGTIEGSFEPVALSILP